MSTASIDFTLSASAMILLVMGAIFGVNMVAEPYLKSETFDEGRYNQIARHILLSEGEPADWGVDGNLTYFGLASTGDAYELDIDKVTRLNSLNSYSLDYGSIWQALGIEDVSFRIEMEPLFDTVFNLDASQSQGGETAYNFTVSTKRDGYPISTQLSYYVIIGNTTYTSSGTTNSSGEGIVQFTLPDSFMGTALLVGFAENQDGVSSYSVLPFAHNSGGVSSSGTYATLSPNDYTLDVELNENNTLTKAAYFSHEYSFEDPGWLQGWDQRVSMTIDHSDVDSPLTDFPLLVHLGDNSGRKGDNVTFVFDELGVDANRLKIAVTTTDGASQCYVEIEEWDDANEEAWLWVKLPSVNSTSDTDLYLYYDADQPDNTVYIGDPNSTPAEAVWGNDFRLVTHMRDDPDTSHVRDSTENDNDGTKTAAGEPVETTGNVSDAQDFDGWDDYVDLGSDPSLDLRSTDFTVEAWIYPTTQTVRWPTIYAVGEWELSLGIGQDTNTDKLEVWVNDRDDYASNSDVTYNEWNYVVLSWNGSHYNFYIDGEPDGSRSGSSYPQTGTTYIGGTPPFEKDGCFSGIIDEVRASNTSRTTSWVKASYESERDNLINFGRVESREAQDRIDYSIPRLVDGGPMVLVITGTNTTHYWAEWAAYPQIPFEIGVDIGADYVVSDVYSVSYIVEIEGGLYRFKMMFRSPHRYD